MVGEVCERFGLPANRFFQRRGFPGRSTRDFRERVRLFAQRVGKLPDIDRCFVAGPRKLFRLLAECFGDLTDSGFRFLCWIRQHFQLSAQRFGMFAHVGTAPEIS